MGGDLFEADLDLPDPEAQRHYNELVGLDRLKRRLSLEGEVLLFPDRVRHWSETHYHRIIHAVEVLEGRPPLMIFGGDVGTGKTTLAETFADEIARRHRRTAQVLRLSLRSRGSGAVGEMTRLLGQAFDAVITRARSAGASSTTILVIDEADAVAQSRAIDQMHHEDRAGVNALIRGIDQIAAERLPIVVVMCTNRVDEIDPAVLRRATVFRFERPMARMP